MATNDDTARSFPELYEEALKTFKAVASIAYLLGADDGADQVVLDAANHAHDLAHQGAELMPELWDRHHADYVPKPKDPGDPPEWTGPLFDAEMISIAKRITALPVDHVRDLMWFTGNVATAKTDRGKPNDITMDDINRLLDKGIGPKHVHGFWWLKHKGAAVVPEVTSAAEGEDAPSALSRLTHQGHGRDRGHESDG